MIAELDVCIINASLAQGGVTNDIVILATAGIWY